MRRHSFFLTLLLGNLLLVGGVVTLVSILSHQGIKRFVVEGRKARQEQALRNLESHLEQSWPMTPAQVNQLVKDSAWADDSILTILGPKGEVIGDERGTPATRGAEAIQNMPPVQAALHGQMGQAVVHDDRLNQDVLAMAVPIHDREGKLVAVARLAVPVQSINADSDFVRWVLLWASLASTGAAAMLGLLISWMWYAPLRQVTQAAKTIASGDLTARAHVKGSSEIAHLGLALNNMRESLSQQMDMIASQRRELQTVISNLTEGVMAIDHAGHIAMANRAGIDLLACPVAQEEIVVGQKVQSAIRLPQVVELHQRAQALGWPLREQFELPPPAKRKFLDVEAIPLARSQDDVLGGLLVVRDVTDIAGAAAMKAEFVANASHELRTPLATVRAAVDSLRGMKLVVQATSGASATVPPATSDMQASLPALKKIMDILDRHVRRLENLTRDLLDLNLIESGRTIARKERVTPASLSAWVRVQYAARASEHGLTLAVEAPDGDGGLITDRVLVELILQNLLENAIKYTPEGGRIECRLERLDRTTGGDTVMRSATEGGSLKLQVRDTGCGIPAGAQAWVFERFYQVEPSRTGEPRKRGTGLGLAIVKHAAERLGGTVELESEVGQGTTVTVVVPGMADEAGDGEEHGS